MAPLVQRRLTPVRYAKQLISAISFIRQQKQIPNFERISRCLQRFSDLSSSLIKKYLDNAVSDGLILEYTAMGCKGQRTGLEQEGYKIPDMEDTELEKDGHDWYCFKCHEPGKVYECTNCFRVYHKLCTTEDTTKSNFTCTTCKACRQKDGMKKELIHSLLSYTLLHLREKFRDLYKLRNKISADDVRRFIYKEMDLNLMEQKILESSYTCMEEFLADTQTILHNCFLTFGEEKGNLTDLANLTVKACKYDLDEIEMCPSCYYLSNTKPEDWFSQPCNPPHELVYAKQKGYSYWPAKVMKDLGGKYDVRFFGAWHERAVIPAEFVKPINTDSKVLALKKTAAFQKSILELKKHQAILKQNDLKTNQCQDSKEDVKDVIHKEPFDQEEFEDLKNYSKNLKKKGMISQTKNKNLKRKRNNTDESMYQSEDETASNHIVSSTSAEHYSEQFTGKLPKNSNSNEAFSVTSSVDKQHKPTVSIAVQTSVWQLDSVSTQTDLNQVSTGTDMATSSDMSKPEEPEKIQVQLNDKVWEERMTLAMASLAKRLEKKFEEEKKVSLRELSQQLEEDFGKDKQQAVERTVASMKLEIEKARRFGEDRVKEQYMEEMKKLAAKHKEAIHQVKKNQWCQNCAKEAIYHCCWNTAYCSIVCQQDHWHKEHKRVCRRKRQENLST